ncbi:hypothetical protein Pmani_010637 [Petrolisthes manimaculis]|uniref:Uncharacterized protein n=1 Tax=Petrolisthes manimaculis TaxID=1843537 RepID=A0AAE1Q146_9EUCA|nr:hypothetical protein Pmani_010637 [Petrolisthes manimaculis]
MDCSVGHVTLAPNTPAVHACASVCLATQSCRLYCLNFRPTVLHNIAIMNRLPLGDDAEDIIEPPVVPREIREDYNQIGHGRRAGIVDRFF